MMNDNNPSKGGNDTRHHRLATLFTALALVVMVPAVTRAGPEIQVGEEGSMKITYTFQMWAQGRGFTSGADNGKSTDIFMRRNRVTFGGQYNDYISYYAQLEGAPDSKGGNDGRSLYFRDAYITLDISDPIRFIAGRFKNTFSRENLEACFEPLTIDRAELISYTPWGGSRETGFAMWGNLADAMLQYRVMLGDGREGEYVAIDSPRITTRVHVSLLDPEYDYGYRGTYLGMKKVFTIGAAYDYQANVAYGDWPGRTDPQDYTGKTVDMFFEYPTGLGTFTLSSAWIKYDTGNAINKSPDPKLAGMRTQLEATYVKTGYLIPGKVGIGRLQLFGRHENSDYNLTSGYRDQIWDSVGFNYYIDGQKLKLTLEYARINFDIDHPTDASLQDYDQTTMGLQLIF